MRRDPIHVLLIEDDEVDATQVRRTLRDEPGRFQLHWVTTLQEGLDHLGKGEVDAVLLDLNLPDSRGVETVVRLRERAPALPIVVLTVAIELRIALGTLQAGAQDFLLKDELAIASVLTRAIRYAIERQKIAYEQRRLEERVARAEKMASLGVLAAGVAVGFNRLLGTILEDADDAMELVGESRDPQRLSRRLNSIRQAALRAGRMAEPAARIRRDGPRPCGADRSLRVRDGGLRIPGDHRRRRSRARPSISPPRRLPCRRAGSSFTRSSPAS